MNIALRKRTLSPVRLVLEDLSKRSFLLFVVISLQLGCIIQINLILTLTHDRSSCFLVLVSHTLCLYRELGTRALS